MCWEWKENNDKLGIQDLKWRQQHSTGGEKEIFFQYMVLGNWVAI